MINILAAGAGLLAISWLPRLPELSLPAWLGLGTAIIPMLFHPRLRVFACFLLGASWAVVSGQHILNEQLPVELEGEDLILRGVISDLPERRGDFQRIQFAVSEYLNIKPEFAQEQNLPRRVLLSWYGDEDLRVAEEWTLRVKLSRPRGFVNLGGFDYHRWLLSRGVGATGYVRASTLNRLHGIAPGYGLQKQREQVRDRLTSAFQPSTNALLVALAVGDSSLIDSEQWDLLRRTGTSHLMAISGLHVGLVAVLGFWLGHAVRALLSMARTRLALIYYLPGVLSCLCAVFYAAMAGFSLPTQRALIMVLLANLAILTGRVGSSARALAWAFLLVLLIDPLSGYEMGFWLSFGAVAFLLFHFQNRHRAWEEGGRLRRALTFGRAQWVVSLGLVLPLLALNQPVSLLSPLANLFAIPLVSSVVVGPLLAGVLLQSLGFEQGAALVAVAAHCLSFCMSGLDWLNYSFANSGWSPEGGAVTGPALVAGLTGIVLLLAPRALPARWLSLPLLLPLLVPGAQPQPPLRLSVLDVGQGLATVVRTENHTLVYDTGPAYSERFNAGEAILGPYLRSRGVRHLDRLIVSHGDGDHAGGTGPLLEQVDSGQLWVGEELPLDLGSAPPQRLCERSEHWTWDGVDFSLIEPPNPGADGNDRSCILGVEYGGQRILITGDIGSAVERDLLGAGMLPRRVTVLVAPHHGSLTSSSAEFVRWVRPAHVVYSAAYRSRYGHPHPEVQARYAGVGSRAHNTAQAGQLDFVWNHEGKLTVQALREVRRRYWFDGP
ncbi:DNA internalization-related competence protein ComEC/Rec2 [Gilvimarinus sp. F26214L]|uniref:DNA internalization-related competence protein ComEC/Rec2 n=1 Tax=Gilvimarinus sp. DZF01 TaxID=3461371 RepID=UPI004045AE5C